MKIQKLAPVACVFGLLCLFTATAQAQQPDVVHPTAAPAPFFEEETAAVVRLDAARIDANALAKQVEAVAPFNERDRVGFNAAKVMASGYVEQFRQAGGREAYVVLTLAGEITKAPFLVVPVPKGADPTPLLNLLPAVAPNTGSPLAGMSAEVWNDAIFYGHKETLSRLKSQQVKRRAVPKEPFEAVANYRIQALYLPNADQRRVLDEFLPGVAASDKHSDAGPWNGGIQWAVMGIGTSDAGVKVKLEVASKDESSARTLKFWTDDLAKMAASNETAKRDIPNIERLVRILAPKVEGNRLTLALGPDEMRQITAVFGERIRAAQEQEDILDKQTKENLRDLVLGMHSYHEVHHQFPPAALRDKDGKPLLSWRVSVLPYVGANDLYKQFHLDEPWDSAHNKKLIAKIPDVFAPPNPKLRAQGKTAYLVPIGEKTIFGPKEGVGISKITDGTMNTMIILEVDEPQAVVWTKPDDLQVDGVELKKVLFGGRKEGFGCVSADGKTHRIPMNADETLLRSLLTRNGAEPIEWP